VRSVIRRPRIAVAADNSEPGHIEPDSPARRGSDNPVLVEDSGFERTGFAALSSGDAGVLEGTDVSCGPLLAVSPHVDRTRPVRGRSAIEASIDWRDTSLDTLVSDLKLSAGPSREGRAAGLRAAQLALRRKNVPRQVPPKLPPSGTAVSRPRAVRRAVRPTHDMPVTRPAPTTTRLQGVVHVGAESSRPHVGAESSRPHVGAESSRPHVVTAAALEACQTADSAAERREEVAKAGFLDRREVLVERVLQASETTHGHVQEADSPVPAARAAATPSARESSSDSDSDQPATVRASAGTLPAPATQLRWPRSTGRGVRLPRFGHPRASPVLEAPQIVTPAVKAAANSSAGPSHASDIRADHDVGSSLESTGYARAFRRQQRHRQQTKEPEAAADASASAHVQWGFPLAQTLRPSSPAVQPDSKVAPVPGSEMRVRRGLAEVLAATRDMVSRVRASAQALRLEEDDELEWSLGSTDKGRVQAAGRAPASASVVSSSRSVISEQPVRLGMGRLASARDRQARAGPRRRYPRQRPPLAATRRAGSAPRGGAGHARLQQTGRWLDGSGKARGLPQSSGTAWEAQAGARSEQGTVAARSELGCQTARGAGRSRSAARRYRDVVAPATTRTRRSAASRSARDRV
jgi:hypothetical protein